MKYRYLVLVALAMVLSGCSLFGGDDASTDVSTAETFQAEPTANVVQAVPADDSVAVPTVAAAAPLPTAVTIPATPAPPEPTADRSQPTSYVVQSGDVLGLIAEQFDVDIAELRRVNDLSGNLIRVGQTLTIPALSGSTATTTLDGAEPADETASAPVGSTAAPTPAPAPTPVSCGSNAVGHCVQSGDSLLGIASKYGVGVDQLRSSNPGITGDTIRIGDLLTIPGQSTSTTTTTTTTTGSGTVSTPDPAVTVAPINDADCAARNAEFPYFHASDGLCYANPIGGATAVPTAQGATADVECPAGTFLWDDGLCYPIPGATPIPAETPTPGTISVDYGTDPCPADFEVLDTGRCWPGDAATDAQKEAACKANCEYI